MIGTRRHREDDMTTGNAWRARRAGVAVAAGRAGAMVRTVALAGLSVLTGISILSGLLVLSGLFVLAGPALAQRAQDTVRIAVTSPIQNLDTHMDPHVTSRFFSRAVFDHLVAFDAAAGKFVPMLATAWRRIDATTMEFDLREDVTWHDGAPFTADDVVYTINWMRHPDTRFRFKFQYSFIKEAQKVGPHRVRIIYNHPEAADLALFSEVLPIYPKHAHSRYEKAFRFGAERPIGTGQFRVVEFKPGEYALLERFDGYRLGAPYNPVGNVRRLRFVNIPDTGAQMASLLANQIDLSRDLSPDDGDNVVRANRDLRQQVEQGLAVIYLAMVAKGRSGAKALQDERVRRALIKAIDREAIQKVLLGGARYIPPPEAMCAKIQAGCHYTLTPPAYDPVRARELLAEAGHAKGLNVELTAFTIPVTRTAAQAVSGFLGAVGVRSTIDAMQVTAYRKKQEDGRIQMMIGPWPGGGIPDINQTVSFIYDTPPSRDYHGDEELVRLARQARSALDPKERARFAQQMFDRATQKAYFIPLAGYPQSFVHHKDLKLGGLGLYTHYGLMPGDINWAE